MATYTEGRHTGEHIVSEANGARSREQGTLASGNLAAGTVLGQITLAGTATAAADAGNTGDGTMGAITVGAGALAGDYVLTITAASTDAGEFEVEDPNGVSVGTGTVGSEFTGGGLTFTLADGAADFAVGDQFVITVDSGSGNYAPLDLSATDGSDVAAAVLYGAVDASAEAQPCVVHVRDCEVDANALTWPTGATEQQIADGTAELATLGVIVR